MYTFRNMGLWRMGGAVGCWGMELDLRYEDIGRTVLKIAPSIGLTSWVVPLLLNFNYL